jgi:hypothetical protein
MPNALTLPPTAALISSAKKANIRGNAKFYRLKLYSFCNGTAFLYFAISLAVCGTQPENGSEQAKV